MKILPHLILAAGAIAVALILRDGMMHQSANQSGAGIATAAEVMIETAPPSNMWEIEAPPGAAASLKKRSDGYYWASARVNNASYVEFMVDTGASICVLTPDDAELLGLDWQSMDKDLKISTAGGTVYGASITMDEMEIGGVFLRDVNAVILDDHLEHSLLGMSFLKRLSRWEVTQRAIVIHQ